MTVVGLCGLPVGRGRYGERITYARPHLVDHVDVYGQMVCGLESNTAHQVLHYLLCRLSDEGRGQLVNARLTRAQATLAKKLGISRPGSSLACPPLPPNHRRPGSLA